MKHLKKLSVVLMMTTLFSVSFTSCIDNEVSPLVEAIYEAQADLIAAQAGVQNAEAALRLAQANSEEALASLRESQAAQNLAAAAATEAQTEANVAMWAEQTRALIAANATAEANAQLELELAQAEFDQALAEIIADMEAAGAQQAAAYAVQYGYAIGSVNSLSASKLTLEKSLADKMLMMTLGEIAPGIYLEQLEMDLANLIASGTAAQQTITQLEAYLANPANEEAQILAMQAQRETLLAANGDIDVEIAELQNTIQDINNQMAANNDLMTLYNNKKSYRNAQIVLRDAKIAANTSLTTANTAAQLAITNYPGVTTTLTTAKNDAITAQTTAGTNVTNAIAALGTSLGTPTYLNSAIAPANTLYKELWNAQLAFYIADNNLTLHNTALAALDASYQTAISDLYFEQGLYDAGIGAANTALATAQSNLLTGQATQIAAQADYNAKKVAFEANPTGFVWTAGVDGVLGIHPTAVGPHNSYIAVTSIVVGAANDVYSAVTTTLPAGNNVAAIHTSNTYAEFRADGVGLVQADGVTPYVLAANDYWNVGADDVAGGTHAARLDAAVVALTAANANVVSLQSAVTAAQLYVDTFGDDLDAALAVYNTQKALYDNGVATKATLTGIRATALTAANTAQTAVTNAANALGVLITPAAVAGNTAITPANTLYKVKWNADLAVANTTLALSTHLATTVAMYQTTITNNNITIANNLLWIAEYNILINQAQLEMNALQAEYDAILATPLYAQLVVDKHIAQMAINELNAEKSANNTLRAQLLNVINAIGTGSLTTIQADITAAKNYLTSLPALIAAKELAIAKGEVDLDKLQLEINALNAQIAALTVRIANAQAIADNYKALMTAALAS